MARGRRLVFSGATACSSLSDGGAGPSVAVDSESACLPLLLAFLWTSLSRVVLNHLVMILLHSTVLLCQLDLSDARSKKSSLLGNKIASKCSRVQTTG